MCLVAGPSQELELAVNRRGVASLLLHFQGGEELELRWHLHSTGGMLLERLQELPSTVVHHTQVRDRLSSTWRYRAVYWGSSDPRLRLSYLTAVVVPAKENFLG